MFELMQGCSDLLYIKAIVQVYKLTSTKPR